MSRSRARNLDRASIQTGAFQSVLRRAWRADTSYDPNGWSIINPAFGQCAVTALIVQDLLGGELMYGATESLSHYWNRLPSGVEIDLTSDQFATQPRFDRVETRSRDYVLSYSETKVRYERLLRRLAAMAL
jgi:hypothetical protein